MILGLVGNFVVFQHMLFAPGEYGCLPGVLVLGLVGLALANMPSRWGSLRAEVVGLGFVRMARSRFLGRQRYYLFWLSLHIETNLDRYHSSYQVLAVSTTVDDRHEAGYHPVCSI